MTFTGTSLAPGDIVQPYPASPPTVGLIASARMPDDQGARWQGGFAYAPENCAGGGPIDPCYTAPILLLDEEIRAAVNPYYNPGNPGGADPGGSRAGVGSKTLPSNIPVVQFQPIILVAGDTCSPWERDRDYQGRARRLLLADQSRQLAREFWRGDVAQAANARGAAWPNRWLADNANVDVVTSAPATPVDALACLEDALAACSPQRGMIHCTYGTLVHWKLLGGVERVGQQMVTPNNTIVVADAGYDGSGPHGQPPSTGSVWAYATDMVDVRLDEIQVYPDEDAQALDRAANTFAFRAERLAAATWAGCCHAAAEINQVLCTHTGGS